MAQWRIKQISELTNISVRMLHHYDKIALLKPSVRASNGYRWYSEEDLMKLQQIIALRYFGFGLTAIKTMLQNQNDFRHSLHTQQQMLQEQAEHLRQAQDAISAVLQRLQTSKSPDWNDLVSLIERYRMAEEVKKTWAGKTLNDEQLEVWLDLRKQYPKEFDTWEELVKQINGMQLGNPEGPEGERVVLALYDIMKKTKKSLSEQRKFNADILKSIKQGTISELPLSPEGGAWLARAGVAYVAERWEKLYQDIIQNLSIDPKGASGKRLARAWRDIIEDQLMGTNPDFAFGLMNWQEVGRQQVELQKQTTPDSPQEAIKKVYAEIFFNPEALSWIEKALDAA